MGTTVTMAFHMSAQLCVVHVGDSRAYLYRDDELHQLTEDHTLVADMVRTGALRRDEVPEHGLRHTITNVVGGPELGVKSRSPRARSAGWRSLTAVFGRIDGNSGE